MVFNSVDFLVFFPIVLLIYFFIPKKVRYVWLLIVSYYFYMSWNPKYAVLIALSTVITYLSGIGIGKTEDKKIKNWIIAGSFVSNLGILFFFKYFDFALLNVNRLLGAVGIEALEKPFDVMLPIGISFYTFQALGYTMDVYRGEMKPEKNIFRYALFVSFFPLIAAGPIERAKNLLKQMQNVHTFRIWNYENITSGAAIMLWGYFMKMVIADRLAIFVDYVFGNYGSCGSTALVLAAVFFAFQLYCDFGSYSLIAMGCAKMMGFSVTENFNTPYFALSIKEFWRRWHISLSSWFRDYLYIPLGGNRKGRMRKYINLMLTFLVSGLWHGASFSFIAWGGLHGLYQVIGEGLRPVRERVAKAFHINTECLPHKLLKGLITFALVDFAWIFFRCNSLTESVAYIKRMLTCPDFFVMTNGTLFTLGLSRLEFIIALAGLVILLAVDLIRYRKGLQFHEYLNTKWIWLRWSVYILLVLAIFLFGIYGPGYNAAEFIYFQF